MSPQQSMKSTKTLSHTPTVVNDDDTVEWGAENIGKFLGRSSTQIHYLVRSGALAGVVQKVGHRTYLATRGNLRRWANYGKIERRSASA
jgi:hypothetical protein